MARHFSGAPVDGLSPVTLREIREGTFRLLVQDFARPGCCIVLGSGASYGVVPMANQVAPRALELLREQSSFPAASRGEFDRWSGSPEWSSLALAMRELCGPMSFERFRVAMMGPGLASYFLHSMFTPADVPSSLYQIYDVLECTDGAIITYNYDRITDRQSRFSIIAVHGQTSLPQRESRCKSTCSRAGPR